MLYLACSVLSGSHILRLSGVKMLNLRARWILWDNTYSVLWRKRGVIWTSRFSMLMRLACSYKVIDKWTYIIQVVYKPLTLNRSETVQPCYCVPVPRVILSPNPSGCTESAIHEHLKGENWTICHLLKVGPKKHEWCLKYCLGVWDWFHNCFILEVGHHRRNENLNIYCREELKCAHLNVVLFMPPNTVSHLTVWSGQNESFQDPLHESLWDSPHEGNTMMDSWKSVTTRDTIGHVGAVQGSIQQAPVKNCWEMFDQTAWKISKSLKVLQKKKKNGDKNITPTTHK